MTERKKQVIMRTLKNNITAKTKVRDTVMSKFLKFIVHFVIVCTIILVIALAVPPFFGVNTIIVDNADKVTNLPLGSVTYAVPVKTEEINAGAPILVVDEGKTYRYNLMSVDRTTNTGTVIDPSGSASESINVSVKNWVPKVVVTVGFIGYLLVATESIEGLIILGLVILFLIILYVIAELCKKDNEAPDEYEDLQGDRRHVKTRKELRMEEKAREKRMQQEDRELLHGEKARKKQARKDEKEKRKKIRTGGFVDEIYEDDLEESDETRGKRRGRDGNGNVQAATTEAHELLKKEIAAATAEDAAADTDAAPEEETSSFRELRAERHKMRQMEEEQEEEPVEIKKLAMPMLSASQLADRAKKAGDTPDIVRDSVTNVTFFDYSDIIGAEEPEVEED